MKAMTVKQKGSALAKVRKKLGLSQHLLATMLGISIPLLSRMECGKVWPKQQLIKAKVEGFLWPEVSK